MAIKNVIKAIFYCFIFINISTINAFSKDLSYIEEGLNSLGVDDIYSENIVYYLENMEISQEDYEKIETNINNIKVAFHENNEDMEVLKYYSAYNNIKGIAEVMNVDLNINFADLSIRLIDKGTNNTLYEGDANSLIQLYSNYKNSNHNINIAEVIEDIGLNISEDNITRLENYEVETQDNYNGELEDIINIQYDENINNTEENSSIINNEANDILDQYIDKFENYNESLLVKNNIVDWDKGYIILGLIGILVIMFLIIYKSKILNRR